MLSFPVLLLTFSFEIRADIPLLLLLSSRSDIQLSLILTTDDGSLVVQRMTFNHVIEDHMPEFRERKSAKL